MLYVVTMLGSFQSIMEWKGLGSLASQAICGTPVMSVAAGLGPTTSSCRNYLHILCVLQQGKWREERERGVSMYRPCWGSWCLCWRASGQTSSQTPAGASDVKSNHLWHYFLQYLKKTYRHSLPEPDYIFLSLSLAVSEYPYLRSK
jgi:hypothetical protein